MNAQKLLLPFLIIFLISFSSTANENDTTKIKVGNTTIIIMSDDSNSTANDSIQLIKRHRKEQRFNKWAGVDLGINGLLSKDMDIDLPKEAQSFDLNYAKSISVGLNPIEKYFPIAAEKFGFTTGLGFQFNSYDMKRDLVFISTDDTTYGIPDTNRNIGKTRIKTTYLQVPLLLETNLGKSAKKSFHLAAGVVLGYRIGSKVKQVYEESGREYKIKDRGDLNLHPFRASLTARFGYGNFTMYANYGINSFFQKNKGPELYPFTLGISLISF